MRGSPVVRWIASMAAIAVGLLCLNVMGTDDLGAPPLSLDGAKSWLEQRDTAVAGFALLRLAAVGLGWYLLLITAIGGAATALRLRQISSVVDRLTFPFARGLLGGVALLGVVGTPAPAQPDTSDSMIELPSDDPTSTSVVPTTSVPDDSATLHLLPDTSASAAPPTETAPSTAPAPRPTPSEDAIDTWVVQRGESFWSIATEHLSDVKGGPVSEHEVDSYWRELVELNRSRLVNADDANLLFTGQTLELPAVTSG